MKRKTLFFIVLLYIGLAIAMAGIPLMMLNIAYSSVATISVFGELFAMIGACGAVVTDEECQ